MGQGLDVLKACDGNYGTDLEADQASKHRPAERKDAWDEDALVGCAALEDTLHSAVATVNRGGQCISDEVLLNHELLQHARSGNVKGVCAALEKGA